MVWLHVLYIRSCSMFHMGPTLIIAMSPGPDPHGAAARLRMLSAYAALKLLVEHNDMKPSLAFTRLGAQDLRELYGLMLRGLPWSYIDLILYAMIFKLPEYGPWMDMVSADTLHFVELFCGVAHMLLACTLHPLTGLSIGCVCSSQVQSLHPHGLQNKVFRHVALLVCTACLTCEGSWNSGVRFTEPRFDLSRGPAGCPASSATDGGRGRLKY